MAQMRKNRVTGLAGGLVLGAVLTAPLWAAEPEKPPVVIETLSVDQTQRLLQEKGYRAEIVTPESGTPYLKSQTGGSYFFASLYDCQDAAKGEACKSLEFTTGPFGAKPAPTGEALARWNAENWWAFGVFDSSGAPYLRSYLSLTGGVTEAHLKGMIELWDWRVNEFAKFIQATAAGQQPAASQGPAPPAPAPTAAPTKNP
jgi:Putative bacterial sensory transduction regulator